MKITKSTKSDFGGTIFPEFSCFDICFCGKNSKENQTCYACIWEHPAKVLVSLIVFRSLHIYHSLTNFGISWSRLDPLRKLTRQAEFEFALIRFWMRCKFQFVQTYHTDIWIYCNSPPIWDHCQTECFSATTWSKLANSSFAPTEHSQLTLIYKETISGAVVYTWHVHAPPQFNGSSVLWYLRAVATRHGIGRIWKVTQTDKQRFYDRPSGSPPHSSDP